MKKIEKVKEKTEQESSEVTSTEPVENFGEATGTEFVPEIKTIDRLDVTFPNVDLNKVVEKINQLVEKYNGN